MKVSNMEDKKEKLPSTRIQCEKLIYINIPKIIDNTEFHEQRFLHILIEFKKGDLNYG